MLSSQVSALTNSDLRIELIHSVNNSDIELFNALKNHSNFNQYPTKANLMINACSISYSEKSLNFLKVLYDYSYHYWDLNIDHRDYLCVLTAIDNNNWQYLDYFLELETVNQQHCLSAILLWLAEDGSLNHFKVLHENETYKQHLQPEIDKMLNAASTYGHKEIIDYVLNAEFYKEKLTNKEELYFKMLNNACHTNEYELFEYLLFNKETTQYLPKQPYDLLFKACHLNYKEIIKLLIIDYNIHEPSVEMIKQNVSQKSLSYEYLIELFSKRKLKEDLIIKLHDGSSPVKKNKI